MSPRLGLGPAAVALATALPWQALAREPGQSLGLPPGITLPPTTEVVPPAPPWDGQAYKGGVVSVSHPLAAQAGADVLARGGNAIGDGPAQRPPVRRCRPAPGGHSDWPEAEEGDRQG